MRQSSSVRNFIRFFYQRQQGLSTLSGTVIVPETMTSSTCPFFIFGVFIYVYFGALVGEGVFQDFFLCALLPFTAVLSPFYDYLDVFLTAPFILYLSFQRSMILLWEWSSGILEKVLLVYKQPNFSFSFHMAITFLWLVSSPLVTNGAGVALTGETGLLDYYFSYFIVKMPLCGAAAKVYTFTISSFFPFGEVFLQLISCLLMGVVLKFDDLFIEFLRLFSLDIFRSLSVFFPVVVRLSIFSISVCTYRMSASATFTLYLIIMHIINKINKLPLHPFHPHLLPYEGVNGGSV